MADRVVFRNSSKFIDVPAIKGTAAKRIDFFVHGTDLLDFVVDDVVSFALIGNDLVIADA